MKNKRAIIQNVILTAALVIIFPGISAAAMSSDVQDFKNPFISALPEPKIPDSETDVSTRTIDSKRPEVEIEPPPIQINGLVWNTKRPQAIVNKKVVTVGDAVDDFTIAGITKAGIDIIYQEKTFFISYREHQNQFQDGTAQIRKGDTRR